MANILEIEGLKTYFATGHGLVQAVRDNTLHVEEGEILGIVGESGSGKSVTMFSVMGLLARNGYVGQGRVVFDGKEVFNIHHEEETVSLRTLRQEKHDYESKMREYRGKDIGMIFQDPMTYLNPILTVGYQMAEGLKKHFNMSKEECRKRSLEMLKLVGITNPERRLTQYPFELSGGMRQRVMIAIAMSSFPKLLIADEPTTALDVTIQAQILDLMRGLKDKMGMSIILITHDLGVVASMCTRIIIMYGGQIMEQGTDREIFYESKHPYTEGLLQSIASYDEEADESKKLVPIEGTPPDLLKPPKGCAFVDRCKYAMKVCKEHEPEMRQLTPTHACKCFLCYPEVESLQKGEVVNG